MLARSGQDAFRDDLVRAILDWARIEKDLPCLVAALVDAGVRVAPIKGVAYAKSLYGTPAERPMADVDLLVHVRHRNRARATLHDLGFTPLVAPLLHHAEAWMRDDLAVDLHWNIIAPGRGHIDIDAVWSRTRSGWPARAEQLEPVDALVFHLVHLSRNRLRLPLINVIDASRLMERANASDALERAAAWGLGRAAAVALRFCRSILGDRSGRPGGWLGPSRKEVAVLAEPSHVTRALFDIATAGSPAQLVARVIHFGANKVRHLSPRAP